jgi:hypothetical protein
MEDSKLLVNAITYIIYIIGIICLYTFFIKKPKKNVASKTDSVNDIILKLYFTAAEITEKYKPYINNCTKNVNAKYGCVLELKLLLKNNNIIHIYCNETYFKVYQNGVISMIKRDIKTLDAYIASNCDIESNLILVEEMPLLA